MKRSSIKSLTPEIISEISLISERTCDFHDNWCETAVQDVADYLVSINVSACPYFSGVNPDGDDFGGCSVDASHSYLVLDDGTIIDPTIRQFLDSPRASPSQKATVWGWPNNPAAPNVAVIPIGHPFISRMDYESHVTGNGWVHKPLWLELNYVTKALLAPRLPHEHGHGPSL